MVKIFASRQKNRTVDLFKLLPLHEHTSKERADYNVNVRYRTKLDLLRFFDIIVCTFDIIAK